MRRVVKIPWVCALYTMGRVCNMPWLGCQNTMDIRDLIYYGFEGPNTMGRVRYTMDRGCDTPWVGGKNFIGRGSDILWIEDSLCDELGGQNTMGRGCNIPWIEGLIYHR